MVSFQIAFEIFVQKHDKEVAPSIYICNKKLYLLKCCNAMYAHARSTTKGSWFDARLSRLHASKILITQMRCQDVSVAGPKLL